MFIICGGEVEDFGGIRHCQQSIKGGQLKIDCKSSAGGGGRGGEVSREYCRAQWGIR